MIKNDLFIKNGVSIPLNELEITASRASGPGGQHVNKTDSRITIRWNVFMTKIFTEEQKMRVSQNLHLRLTSNGDLIVHNSESRSQQQNKQLALQQLAQIVRKALFIPKKRMATKVSSAVKAARLDAKTHRSSIKKLRSKKNYDD